MEVNEGKCQFVGNPSRVGTRDGFQSLSAQFRFALMMTREDVTIDWDLTKRE